MKLAAVFILAAALSAAAQAATITVTITGTTGEIKVGEGPIFGHSSYQKIPPGDPFVLTYTFDDERGKQAISEISGDTITQSEIENTALSSPGTNAVLQIGSAVWEFGASTRSHASPRGGYIVEEVTRTILGTKPDGSAITPSSIKYWQAWKVPAGSNAPENALDSFPPPAGSTGEDTVSAVARFYEGLILPPAFAVGNSPYAGERPSSTTDPKLSTSSATLPVTVGATLHF